MLKILLEGMFNIGINISNNDEDAIHLRGII